jgi:hypothetical protein
MISSNGQVSNTYNGTSLYRANLISMLSGLIIIQKIQQYDNLNHETNRKSATINSSHQSSMKSIKKLRNTCLESKTYYSKDSDIILTILNVLKQLKYIKVGAKFKQLKAKKEQLQTNMWHNMKAINRARELAHIATATEPQS